MILRRIVPAPLLKEYKIIYNMLERLAPTGSGFPTVYVGDQALHSRYNPRLEAEKYVNSLAFRGEPLFFILIEPGLEYTVQVLRRRFPEASILSLHVSDFFPAPGMTEEADAAWSPGTGIPLQQFLEDHLPDIDAARIRVIEWRPAQAIYGGGYLRLFAETAEFVKRVDANKKTVRNFGRRWFRNVIKNLALIRKGLRIVPLSCPIVITGAGPSLEEALPLILHRARHGGLFVLAASSSVPALFAGGVVPDLVLSTDGGPWALLHLYESLRQGSVGAFAASLCAALPSQMAAVHWLPLSDASLWQNLLLKAAGCPALSLPQRGTVTATALDLAFAVSGGPVYIAGMDLARRDLATHARPYAFDRFTEQGASRLSPAYSQAFASAALQDASGSSLIYAAWFRRQAESWRGRLFSLGNNNPVFASGQTADFLAEHEEERQDPLFFEFTPSPEQTGAFSPAEILLQGLEQAGTKDTLAEELGPLLFPDMPLQPVPSPPFLRDLKEEIERMCGGSYG
jgi:hypothetical protein